VDGPGFRKSPFYSALMASVAMIPPARAGLSKLEHDCGFDPLERLGSFALSATIDPTSQDPKDPLFALSFEVTEQRALACVAGIDPDFKPDTLANHRALNGGDLWVVADGTRLLFADKARLQAVLATPERTLELPPARYLFAAVSKDNPLSIERAQLSAALLGTDTELLVTARTGSAAAAETLRRHGEEFKRQAATRIADSDQDPQLKAATAQLLARVTLAVHESQLEARLQLPQAEAESALTGVFSALAVYGVQKYLLQAKTAEARYTVARIAKQVASAVTERHLSRLPKAAPLTPKQVPRGEAVLVPEADWAEPAWRALSFSMEGKQNYSYEFEVAADGKHGVVRAQGDLNGDGVFSRFELGLTLKAPGYVILDAEMREQNPEE